MLNEIPCRVDIFRLEMSREVERGHVINIASVILSGISQVSGRIVIAPYFRIFLSISNKFRVQMNVGRVESSNSRSF